MNQPNQARLFSLRSAAALIGLCLILFLLAGSAQWVRAQTQEAGWSTPINLSRSGASSDPVAVVDSDGTTHVIWVDQFTGYKYSQSSDGASWSAATNQAFIFGQNKPRLEASSNGYIYAFWIDNINNLHGARTLNTNFKFRNAWEDQGILGQKIVAYDVDIDAQNVVRISMVSTGYEIQSPGIYYRQTISNGVLFGQLIKVYTSLYYRDLTQDSAKTSIISYHTKAENDLAVWIAWDDPFLNKIFTSQPNGNLATWKEAEEIDTHISATSTIPINTNRVDLKVWNDDILITWMKSVSDSSCAFEYQLLAPGAADWTTPKPMMAEQYGCPSQSNFLVDRPNFLVWQSIINRQVYLLGWDGTQWSEPQLQTDLVEFRDATTNRSLTADCHYETYNPIHDTLGSFVCDQNGYKDIWFSSKPVGKGESWFFSDAIWSKGVELSGGATAGELNSSILLSDDKGNFTSLWINSVDQAGSKQDMIAVSSWNGATWSESANVITPPSVDAYQLSGTLTAQGDLALIWLGPNPGELYFSKVDAARAYSPAEWSTPKGLSTSVDTLTSPIILKGAGTDLLIFYAIPVNENRGIYLLKSTDGGLSWADPVKIFDAQAAGWEMVDQPKAALGADGSIHLLWQQKMPLEANTALGLGYQKSVDGGNTWSPPDLSVRGNHIHWAGITSLPNGEALRIWRQESGNHSVIRYQASTRNGSQWSEPEGISLSGKPLAAPVLVANAYSGINLFQAIENDSGRFFLTNWNWAANAWQAGDNLEIERESSILINDLSGAISPNRIMVLYSLVDLENDQPKLVGVTKNVDFSNNAAVLAATAPALQTQPTAVPETAPTQAVENSVASTATSPAAPNLSNDGEPIPGAASNSWGGLVVGVVLATIIVGGILGFLMYASSPRAQWKK